MATSYTPRTEITTNYGTRLNVYSYLWSNKIQPWKTTFQPWKWKNPVQYNTRPTI